MSTYPDFKSIFGSDQKSLLEVRRALRSELSNTILLILSTIGVGVLNYYFHDLTPPDLPILRYLSVRWLSIIPALLLLEILRKYHDDLYVFELHRITQFEGRLSLTYQIPNVRYSDIRAVTVSQDLLGRIFDYGNVELNTAGIDRGELVLEGVRSPEQLMRLIEDFRRNSLTILESKRMPVTVAKRLVNADEESLLIMPS